MSDKRCKIGSYQCLSGEFTELKSGSVRVLLPKYGYIEITPIEDGLAVHASLGVFDELLVQPRASNSIYVRAIHSPARKRGALKAAKANKKAWTGKPFKSAMRKDHP